MNKENSKIKIALLVLSLIMLIAANIYFIHFFAKATASCYGLFSGPYVETSDKVNTVLNISSFMQTMGGKAVLLFIGLVIPLVVSILFMIQKKNISIPSFINSVIALLLIVITVFAGMTLNSACDKLKGSLEINQSVAAYRMLLHTESGNFAALDELPNPHSNLLYADKFSELHSIYGRPKEVASQSSTALQTCLYIV